MQRPIRRRTVLQYGIGASLAGLAGCLGDDGGRNLSAEGSFGFDVDSVSGITAGAGSLWFAGDGSDGSFTLFEVDPESEAIQSRTPVSTPHEFVSARGLAYVGESVWVTDNPPGKVYEVEPSSGSIQSEIDAPGVFAEGLTWDGESFWHANESEDGDVLVYHLEPTGEVVDRLTPPDENAEVKCLAWVEGSLWLVQERVLYETDPGSLAVQNEFEYLDVLESAQDGDLHHQDTDGLCWDGTNLWVKGAPASPNEIVIFRLGL